MSKKTKKDKRVPNGIILLSKPGMGYSKPVPADGRFMHMEVIIELPSKK